MTGSVHVGRFKIYIQDCVLPGFPRVTNARVVAAILSHLEVVGFQDVQQYVS